MKNCLNCKFEPEWDTWEKRGDHEVQAGYCKWDELVQELPEVYCMIILILVRYSDDSGMPTQCKTWEAKE